VSRAPPFGNARGQEFFDGVEIHAREDADDVDGFVGRAFLELLAKMVERFWAERFHHGD